MFQNDLLTIEEEKEIDLNKFEINYFNKPELHFDTHENNRYLPSDF